MTLDGIRNKTNEGQYGFSDHAVKRMIKDPYRDRSVEAVIPCKFDYSGPQAIKQRQRR